MDWEPVTESRLWDFINSGLEDMTPEQERWWDLIKVIPEKWQQEPYGNSGSGFWVVGIIGQTVIWYNDIEEGFNRSTYSTLGRINEYWCDQDELNWSVQKIINHCKDGYDSAGRMGPPLKIS